LVAGKKGLNLLLTLCILVVLRQLTAEKKMDIKIVQVKLGKYKGRYRLDYYNQYGVRKRPPFNTLEEALAEKQRLESQQSRVFVETEEYTFGDLYNHYEPVVKKIGEMY
jgi:hypothetical protein